MKRIREEWTPKEWFFLILLVMALIAPLILLGMNDANLVNSDDSSELIFAEMVSHKNCVLTRGWVYSTSIPVVSTQIIRAILFKFTNNWTLVRIFGNLALSFWLLLSYAFLIFQLNVSRKWFLYTSPFILIPFSYESFYIIGLMHYYTPFLSFSFVILGLWLYLYYKKKYSRIAHWALLICSFVSCLGGIRQFELTFLPMIIALFFYIIEYSNEIGSLGMFLKKTYYFWTSLLSAVAGCCVNAKVLSKWFVFMDYGEMHLSQFKVDRVQVILRYFLNAVGYTEDAPNVSVFSMEGILYLLSLAFLFLLILMIVILWKRRRQLLPESQFLLWFSLSGFFLNVFIFMFTEIAISARYYVLNVIMYVPLLIVFYRESGLSLEIRRLFFLVIILMVCVLGGKEYERCLKSDANEARKGHIAYLLENDYRFGYSTPWNANVLTELTEGQVEMVSVNCSKEGVVSLNPWLVKLENLYPPEPRNSVFLLLNGNELRRFGKITAGREPVYEDANYYIYLYQDTDEILDLINRSGEE